MKRFIVVAAFAAIMFAGPGAAKDVVHSPSISTVTVDGLNSEWAAVPVLYLEEGPRVTAIANDDRYLYVHFRFADLDTARTVLAEGVVVWVNPGGEKEPSFGLRYRGTGAIREALDDSRAAGGDGPPAMGEPRALDSRPRGHRPEPPGRAKLGALEVMHFGAVDGVIDDAAAHDGPAAAAAVCDGAFSYELRVPLSEVPAAAGGDAARCCRTLNVGFQVGGLTKAEREARKGRMDEGGGPGGRAGPGRGSGGERQPGGAGGGRGPGGGSGGFRPAGGGPRPTARAGEILWVEVILSGPGSGAEGPAGSR